MSKKNKQQRDNNPCCSLKEFNQKQNEYPGGTLIITDLTIGNHTIMLLMPIQNEIAHYVQSLDTLALREACEALGSRIGSAFAAYIISTGIDNRLTLLDEPMRFNCAKVRREHPIWQLIRAATDLGKDVDLEEIKRLMPHIEPKESGDKKSPSGLN